MRWPLLFALTVLPPSDVHADGLDTTFLRRLGVEVSGVPGWMIAADSYEKKWLKGRFCTAVGVALRYTPAPCDSDDYAADYNYPTIIAGVKYNMNHGVTMHRERDPDWGLLEPVDYTSRLGNIVTVYGAFERPVMSVGRWTADYTLAFGVGYSRSKYNTRDAIDHELIGSRWLIYFGAGVHATYRVSRSWGVRAGMEFYHHSNGALNRPNKGANVVAPSFAVVYEPHRAGWREDGKGVVPGPMRPYSFLEVAVGMGGKTLNEEWQLTQFRTVPGEPGYRTSRFKLYAAWSGRMAVMRRYARRWATGVGADVFYGTYASRVAEIDEKDGLTVRHSPWSVGVSVNHRAYFHRLSLEMAVGYYLFRHAGDNARQVETRYYERIGLHYSLPILKGITMGIDVKAHKTKADLTEIVIAKPFRL